MNRILLFLNSPIAGCRCEHGHHARWIHQANDLCQSLEQTSGLEKGGDFECENQSVRLDFHVPSLWTLIEQERERHVRFFVSCETEPLDILDDLPAVTVDRLRQFATEMTAAADRIESDFGQGVCR